VLDETRVVGDNNPYLVLSAALVEDAAAV